MTKKELEKEVKDWKATAEMHLAFSFEVMEEHRKILLKYVLLKSSIFDEKVKEARRKLGGI